ncbi:deoxyribonuclease-1-like [Scleropages formosus]|uniref:deoxyribonuclease-1-like n=1 Tax=Scleropages formosus TaxID=113540 RepID=UPI0010FABDB6|nr:deoxyribonuclease-1-like [Scleropages formosus]
MCVLFGEGLRMRTVCVLGLMLVGLQLATGTLLIGAFNIQTLGPSKMSKPVVVQIIVNIIRRYDVLVVQEVRDKDESVTNELMNKVNEGLTDPYYYTVSEALGMSSYKERYLFIYRSSKVTVIQHKQYPYGSGNDAFSRPPYAVKFSNIRSATAATEFVLVPQHTSPSKAVEEINALYYIFPNVQTSFSTNTILLLGDFNAGCSYVTTTDWPKILLHADPTFTWLIPDSADTTVSDTVCPYDRIVATATMMKYVDPHSAQVFNFRAAYGLDQSLVRTFKLSTCVPGGRGERKKKKPHLVK